jgi:hypothetical protein
MGHKALITQLLYSRFEAYVFSDEHEERWHMEGEPKDSLDLREAQRWMHKSEELAVEIAKSRKNLYDTLGLIRSYFTHSEKLKELTNKIYHSKGIEIKVRPIRFNAEQIKAWKEKNIKGY